VTSARSPHLVERLLADLHAPIDPVAFAWFRRFFLGKLLFSEILSIGGAGLPLLLAVVRASIFAVGAALSESSRWRRLGGVGLDVFWQEPWNASDPLFARDNVIALPHIAGATEEAYARIAAIVARKSGLCSRASR
jgi:hypothetical protein